jgi:hypothetical protein
MSDESKPVNKTNQTIRLGPEDRRRVKLLKKLLGNDVQGEPSLSDLVRSGLKALEEKVAAKK